MIKPYIIAECGLSHKGDIGKAKEMINEAKKCGADAVKFQMYDPYKIFTNKDDAKLREQYQFNISKNKELYKYSKSIGIDCGFSFFDNMIDRMFNYTDFIKIASRSIYNFEYIISFVKKELEENNKPIYLSTGYALPVKLKQLGYEITPMACISEYPTWNFPAGYINDALKYFGKVGYSSHVVYINKGKDCLLAYIHGASVIEKHFCLKRDEIEIDKDHSLEPEEFKNMIKVIELVKEDLCKSVKFADQVNGKI